MDGGQDNGQQGDRDPRGRFLPGHKSPGPGNMHGRRACALRRAALDAVTDADMRAVFTKAVELAKAGDVQAMKFVTERILGRPREEVPEAEPLPFEITDLETAAGISAAAGACLQALAQGAVSIERAQQVLGLLETRRRCWESAVLEGRLKFLEEAVQHEPL